MTICAVRVAIGGQLLASLQAVEGYHEIDTHLPCELVPGHAGLHHTLGQTPLDSDGTDLWIRWAEGFASEMVQLPGCDAWHGEAVCLLFEGHDGPHSDGQTWWP